MIEGRQVLTQMLSEREHLDAAVEVGVAEGLFARELVNLGFGTVYLVDVWKHVGTLRGDGSQTDAWHEANYQNVLRLAEEHPDTVSILRGMSNDMVHNVPDASLDFIHIDATHYREHVLNDLRLWAPKAKPGAIISGHDYLNTSYTVKAGVDDYAAESGVDVQCTPYASIENACFWFIAK